MPGALLVIKLMAYERIAMELEAKNESRLELEPEPLRKFRLDLD